MPERRFRRRSQADDRGFTLIELIVTMSITSVLVAMTSIIIVNVINQTTGEDATVSGVQQAQQAERSFTQYLRSTGVPQLETIEIQLCPTKSKYVDSLEVLYGLPATGTGSTGLHECISPNSPTTDPNAVPAGVRLVEAFDISPPGTSVVDIFSYYTFSGSAFNQVSTSVAAATPKNVAAVGISITFLAPPGGDSRLYHTELGTTVQTEVFIRNAS
jgi:prepilin-type N-terminal cleavage/methylation domain-containing protein